MRTSGLYRVIIQDIENLLFDLDGTLVDSNGTISASLNYALDKLGVGLTADYSVETFIGMPLLDIFRNEFELSTEQADTAIAHYRVHYDELGRIYRVHYDELGRTGSRIYSNIEEVLSELRHAGYRLFVATVKPTAIAKKVLLDWKLIPFFDGVAGASVGHQRRDKSSIIAHVLDEFQLDPSRSMMIGDRAQDIAGARENGLSALAVAYGFGSREELHAAGPDYIVEHAAEIAALLQPRESA